MDFIKLEGYNNNNLITNKLKNYYHYNKQRNRDYITEQDSSIIEQYSTIIDNYSNI